MISKADDITRSKIDLYLMDIFLVVLLSPIWITLLVGLYSVYALFMGAIGVTP